MGLTKELRAEKQERTSMQWFVYLPQALMGNTWNKVFFN